MNPSCFSREMPSPPPSSEANSLPALVAEFPESIRSPALARGLRDSLIHLSSRGLVQATRWSAELLTALPEDERLIDRGIGEDDGNEERHDPLRSACFSSLCLPNVPQFLVVAKTYFDTRQYRRCAAFLERARATSNDPTSEHSAAKFLRCYALFLCTEKDAAMDGAPNAANANRIQAQLQTLRSDLEQTDDPHCCYLLAVILDKLELGIEDGTIRALLVSSVSAFPWNWAAWKRLETTVADGDEARAVVEAVCANDGEDDVQDLRAEVIASATRRLGSTQADLVGRRAMCVFFWAWACLNNDGAAEARDIYTTVVGSMEDSVHFKGCLATALYHLRLFDEAQDLFEEVFGQDEFCLEGVDTYSNILYVKEDKVQLSMLAQRCMKVDKYCVETCCVVGNYYSLRGQHEQAVSYFQRALKLNPSYLSAWTLMGHEYVEMKNTAAAVEAYRRAVDVSPKDFRAWYGLGQTYELLEMPLYTLYYYGKAAALQPRDARMWCAVGETLAELSRLPDAIRAYERANKCDDREGLALSKLATLYEKLASQTPLKRAEYTRLACYYHTQNLARRDSEGANGVESAAAIRFLADFAVAEKDWGKAEQWLLRLINYAGHKEYAESLLRSSARLKSTSKEG